MTNVRTFLCAVTLIGLGSLARAESAPPDVRRISIAPGSSTHEVVITGASSAVQAGSKIIAVNLDTGHFSTTIADGNGAFRTNLIAPAGTSVLIKTDATGFLINRLLQSLQQNVISSNHIDLCPLSGTIINVAVPPVEGGVAFGGAGVVWFGGDSPFPLWTFDGSIDRNSVASGASIRIKGRLSVISSVVDGVTGAMSATMHVTLQRMTYPDGRQSFADDNFMSVFMTPTDLPIERQARYASDGDINLAIDLRKAGAGRAEGTVDAAFPIPNDLRDGYFRPRVQFSFSGVPMEIPPEKPVLSTSSERRLMYLPLIRVGNPSSPQLAAMLLLDDVGNGSRGARAIEDRGYFDIAQRILTNGEIPVLRRVASDGSPLTYRLEPFVPLIGSGNVKVPLPPLIPFRLPSGELTVRLTDPAGQTRTIGPAPLVQMRVRTPADDRNDLLNDRLQVADVTQLSTMDSRFEVAFPADGRYSISIDGHVDDVWGVSWQIRGTYQVDVARALSLDTAMLPGTPLEETNSLHHGVTITPPVPADVEFRLRFAPFSDTRIIERVVSGKANRYGYFAMPARLSADVPGEYRADVSASFRDKDGSLWVGRRTWGSVVAPRTLLLIAHGRRGIEKQTGIGQAWFFRNQTGLNIPGPSHMFFPFHSGDVTWEQKSDTTFVTVTVEDRAGDLVTLLRKRALDSSGRFFQTPAALNFDERAAPAVGEAPLFSSRPDWVDPHLDISKVDLWAYSYASAQRPLVRVREEISEDADSGHYWGFRGKYMRQLGVGANGDLPNDIKFMFGAAVARGPALPAPRYAIYGSLFVLVPDNDPGGGSRTFPPFQGNGGGPSGGPLFTLKGKAINIFFYPTALRAGSILQLGDTASFAGYSAPTIASKVEIVVTSPSGLTRTVKGQANKIGYFYDPANDFAVYESGVWSAKVKIFFDGLTSAGQVTAPFPAGDVLGSREGEFYFYVVKPDAPPATLAPMPQFVRPADRPITFTITPPFGLTNVRLTYTTTMPGFILEEGATSTLAYTYDATRLARDFPNLDLHDADGLAGVDIITLSFLVSGTDASGNRKHFARQIVLQGEELQMPEQKETIIPPRRRAVGRR